MTERRVLIMGGGLAGASGPLSGRQAVRILRVEDGRPFLSNAAGYAS